MNEVQARVEAYCAMFPDNTWTPRFDGLRRWENITHMVDEESGLILFLPPWVIHGVSVHTVTGGESSSGRDPIL